MNEREVVIMERETFLCIVRDFLSDEVPAHCEIMDRRTIDAWVEIEDTDELSVLLWNELKESGIVR